MTLTVKLNHRTKHCTLKMAMFSFIDEIIFRFHLQKEQNITECMAFSPIKYTYVKLLKIRHHLIKIINPLFITQSIDQLKLIN